LKVNKYIGNKMIFDHKTRENIQQSPKIEYGSHKKGKSIAKLK